MRMRSLALVLGMGLAVAGGVASCGALPGESAGAGGGPAESPAATGVEASPEAGARVASLRRRFRVQGGDGPVLGDGVAIAFEARGEALRPVLPVAAKSRVLKPASVELPAVASGFAQVDGGTPEVRVRFALVGAAPVPAAVSGGFVVYPGALGGADVIHRVHAEGTEDFVVFEARPAREELTYDVDVARVPGLRLVGNTVEFVDHAGTPALRVAPPYVVDARGARHEATLAIEGCAFDQDPAAPWGRPVTAPGSARCTLRVAWRGPVAYPAAVDPSWVATGSMAHQRAHHTATLLGTGKVLVAGGRDVSTSTTLKAAELYDPGTGTFAGTGAMESSRTLHTANRLGSGKILIAGGMGASQALGSAELYDPAAGTFAATASLSEPRYRHMATLLGTGKVLLAGGTDGTGILKSAELYDPTAGTFGTTGSMGFPRRDATASLLASGKVLVAGGFHGAFDTATAELYDPAGLGAFTPTGDLTVGRSLHTATVLTSGKVLVVGGSSSGTTLLDADLYNPATGTFASTGALASERQDHTASLLPSGKVLVAGGYAGSDLASSELYDPAAGAFAAGASLADARSQHTATVLASGRVLVAGGATATAELWNATLAGGTCTKADDCGSGLCLDGICCAGACAGSCKTCTAGTGACASVTLADDPDTCTGLNTCDATGACKVKNGNACASGSVCASGSCADGVCCDSACAGGCDRCNLPGQVGTCTVLPAADPGVNPACAPYLCDGAKGACPTSCTADSGCAATHFCAANGTCQPRKAQGGACNLQADCKQAGGCRECATNSCADGVCCNAACDLACDVCSLAAGGSADGTCVTAPGGKQTPQCDGANSCNGSSPQCPTGCTKDADCGGAEYCSKGGNCLPHKAQGAVCDSSATGDCKVAGCQVCQSNNCVDGVCCDTACGACGSCKTPAAGTCTPITKDLPPVPAGACGAYLCDGTKATCPTSCATNADCVAIDICVANQCVPKLAQGAACAANAECSTGFCADGVCCDTACAGTCVACAAGNKQSGTASGTCGPAKQGTNPGGQCVVDAGNACGTLAACAGTSPACALAPSGTSCGATTCSGTSGDVVGKICDGLGACKDSVGQSCAPYVCQGGACASPCTADSDCVAGNYCAGGLCVAQSDLAEACAKGGQCLSGFCFDGVCCDTPCDGMCQACAEPGSLGICKSVLGVPRPPRQPCVTADPDCRGICGGDDGFACVYPDSSTPCGASSCDGAVVTTHACDGAGLCATTPITQDCGAYACVTTAGQPGCNSTCAGPADCATGAACNATTQQCFLGEPTCKDAFTVVDAAGNETSCEPYKCASGACAATCTTANDCADGFDCAGGHCEKKSTGSGGSGTGGSSDTGTGGTPVVENKGCCTVAPGSSGDARQGAIVLVLALAGLTRGRRRRDATPTG